MRVGDHVVYVDEKGMPRPALLTAVWDGGQPENDPTPSVNLVFVSSDKSKEDGYGRQIERRTSVVHGGGQGAPGNYWREFNSDPVHESKSRQ